MFHGADHGCNIFNEFANKEFGIANVARRERRSRLKTYMDSSRIRIVLVQPSHPGNIGAVARAMGNMGLHKLYLVAPKEYPSPEAVARAAAATSVLDDATVCAHLDDAIGDCRWVVGTSARQRAIDWPEMTPRAAMAQAAAESTRHEVAIVFGRESSGLSNGELDRCDMLVRVPVAAEFASLNLAAAVLILAYELRLAGTVAGVTELAAVSESATAEQVQHFYEHLEVVLGEIGFLNAKPPIKLMRRLKALFRRSRLSTEDINILRGILTAVQQPRVRRDPVLRQVDVGGCRAHPIGQSKAPPAGSLKRTRK